MKLINVLSTVNQIEKSKFLNFLEKVATQAANNDSKIKNKINNIEGQFRNATNSQIVELFNIVSDTYLSELKAGLSLLDTQVDLLVSILSRDGNSIARTSWLENLYQKEVKQIKLKSKEISELLNKPDENNELDFSKKIKIYHACFYEALNNDIRFNREAKVSNDERSILNILAKKLNLAKAN